MLSPSNQGKGYFLSLEALICLSILTLTLTQFSLREKPDLNDELAYQQAQDIVEACIRKEEPTEKCFKKVNRVNPRLKPGKEGEFSFKRKIGGELKEIEFRLTRS